MLGVLGRAALSPDGQHPIVPQRGRHRRGVHVFGQLAFVGEGVHDGAIRGQLGEKKWMKRGDFCVQAEWGLIIPFGHH